MNNLNQPWICPKCGRVYLAPYITECRYCNNMSSFPLTPQTYNNIK